LILGGEPSGKPVGSGMAYTLQEASSILDELVARLEG